MLYSILAFGISAVGFGGQAEGRFCSRVVKSSCPDGEIHPWNKENVSHELKSWLQSVQHDNDSISAVKETIQPTA